MFTGEYNHSIDTKGRVTVPAKFRDLLGEQFTVTKGLDRCLWVFPKEAWDEFAAKLVNLPTTMKEARKINHFFLAGASETEPDKMGRILIPQPLRDYAGLDKDVVLIGAGTRAEIWNKSAWEEASTFDDVDELAEQLGDMGFGI